MSVSAQASQGPHHSQGPILPSMSVATPPPPQIGNLGPLRYQLEFYFSRQNLAKDKYLLGQLNSPDHPGAVSMGLICNFPKVRQINALIYNMGHLSGHMAPTADPNLVRIALHQSQVVTVSSDGAWLILVDSSGLLHSQQQQQQQQQPKPPATAAVASTTAPSSDGNPLGATASTPSSPSSQATASSSLGIPTHPLPPSVEGAADGSHPMGLQNNIVVMVDLPSTVTSDELVGLFAGDDSMPPAVRTAKDDGGNWEVIFPDEESARRALVAARERTIQGSLVRGYIKGDVGPGVVEKDAGPQRIVNTGVPPLQAVMPMGYPMSMPMGFPFPGQPPLPMAFFGYNPAYPMPQPPMHMSVPHQALYHPSQGYNPGMLRNTAYSTHARPPPSNAGSGMNAANGQPYAQQQNRNNNNGNGQRNDRNPAYDTSNRRNMVKNWQPKNPVARVGKQSDSGSLNGQQQQQQQQQQKDAADRSKGRTGMKQGMKSNNNRHQQKPQKEDTPATVKKEFDSQIDLTVDNFPALGGGSGKPISAPTDRSYSVATGYAAALRKNTVAAPPSQTSTTVPAGIPAPRLPEAETPDIPMEEKEKR